MTGLTWRPASRSDATGITALFQEIERLAPIGLDTEPAEVQGRLTRPQLDLATDTLAGLDPAGRLLAYAEAADMGVGQGQFRLRITSAVHPALAPDVVASTLDWLLARARGLRQKRSPHLPGVLGARCAATDQARLTLLTEAGFEIDRWHQDLIRGVAEPPPADTPAGPDVAGFLFSLEHHDSNGVSEALLHCLGTRPQWRQRGLATTLISHALAAYQRAGFSTARLEVYSTNTTALRLYTQLGFTPSGRGFAMLQAPIRAR